MVRSVDRGFDSLRTMVRNHRATIAQNLLALGLLTIGGGIAMVITEVQRPGKEAFNAAIAKVAQDRWDKKVREFQESRGVNLIYGEGNVVKIEFNDSLVAAPLGYDALQAAADRIKRETLLNTSAPSYIPDNPNAKPPLKGGIYISTSPN